MPAVAIDRFRVRYRTRRDDVRAQPRLQRIVLSAVEDKLEGALDRAGIGRDEIVCIRDLRTVVRLRLKEPDSTLTEAFGEALAHDIAAAARRSSTSTVVYPSRAHAIVDLAAAAARGDAGRSWAWSQVGIWRSSWPASIDAMVHAVMCALTDEPRHAVAILSRLASVRENAFHVLIERAGADDWIDVARSAAAAAGAPVGWLEERAAATDSEPESGPHVQPAAPLDGVRSVVARCLKASVIARASLARLAADSPLDANVAGAQRLTAVAVLAILEVEPAWLPATADRLRQTLAAAQRELRALATGAARSVDDTSPAIDRQTIPAATAPRDADVAATPASTLAPDAIEPERAGDTREAIEQGAADGESNGRSIEGVRRLGSTEFGGVLFFLNVVEETVLAALREDRRLIERGLRWTLHQLAVLLGGDPGDAGVLAFAGLPPDGPDPSAEQPPPDAAELDALHEYRRALLVAVRKRLGDADAADAALIQNICARRGTILADPGWIELHLPADHVSVEIRRCGLDRDPGWLPWLGVVVRFRYV